MTTLRRVLQLSKQQKDGDVEDEGVGKYSRKRRKRRSLKINTDFEDLSHANKKRKPRSKRTITPSPIIHQESDKEEKDEENVKKMTTRSASRGVTTPIIPVLDKLDVELEKKPKLRKRAVVDVSWVQCDKCKEWYVLPAKIDQKSLPQYWYCELITWSHTPEYHKQQCFLRKNGGVAVNVPAKQAVPTQDQWIECDDCKKWRKIPSTVDTSKLPAKWYCYMNVYDPLHNSCRIAQEKYQERNGSYIYTQQSKELKKKKNNKNQFKGTSNAYDETHSLNKLIKKQLRQRPLPSCFVYGIEEKKLKKNKRNPTTFKELVWWTHNYYRNEEYKQMQSEDLETHFKGSSLFLPEEIVSKPLSKRKKSKLLPDNLAKPTTFHKLFFSDSRVTREIKAYARENNILLSNFNKDALKLFTQGRNRKKDTKFS